MALSYFYALCVCLLWYRDALGRPPVLSRCMAGNTEYARWSNLRFVANEWARATDVGPCARFVARHACRVYDAWVQSDLLRRDGRKRE